MTMRFGLKKSALRRGRSRAKKNVFRLAGLLFAFWLLARCFFCTFADDSNAGSGDGYIGSPYSAYYIPYEYGWRISLFAAKTIGLSEDEYKAGSLFEDFYDIGSLTVVNQALYDSLGFYPDGVVSGKGNKIYYSSLSDISAELSAGKASVFLSRDCPAPPIVSEGDIDTVNAYFLDTRKLPGYLEKIALSRGYFDGWSLVRDLDFSYYPGDGDAPLVKTGDGWGRSAILPSSYPRRNYIPWVLVYEPVICVYLSDYYGTGSARALLTATEFALCQGTLWNWHTVGSDLEDFHTWNDRTYYTGGLYPQCVQSLAFKNLPSSVVLEEDKHWFGFGTVNKEPGEAWSVDEVIEYGGWGMGYLSPADSFVPDTGTFTVEPVLPLPDDGEYPVNTRGGYTRGTDVITSFVVKNNGIAGVTPDSRFRLKFYAFDRSAPGSAVYIGISKCFSLPAGEDGYIWFRWTVPDSFGDECRIVSEILGPDDEEFEYEYEPDEDEGNVSWPGFAAVTVPVFSPANSHTPRPATAEAAPSGYRTPAPSGDRNGEARWHFWTYADGEFSRHDFSAEILPSVSATPDPSIRSTYLNKGVYVMKSGYGLTVVSSADVRMTCDGEDIFTTADVTGAQRCHFYFPEFSSAPSGYSKKNGEFETAEKDGTAFVLPDAGNGKRQHYTPIWFPDDNGSEGNYVVVCELFDCWTPAGNLCARVKSAGISISGNMYDDWYVGR